MDKFLSINPEKNGVMRDENGIGNGESVYLMTAASETVTMSLSFQSFSPIL
jgi:hypothetical protein